MVKVFSEETNSNDEHLIGFALVQPFESYETIGYRNESLIDLNGNIIGDIKGENIRFLNQAKKLNHWNFSEIRCD